MSIIKGKSLLDMFRRANPSFQETEGEVKQRKSGGYGTKRVRLGRQGDKTGNARTGRK